MIVDYTIIPLLPPFQPGRRTARMAIPPVTSLWVEVDCVKPFCLPLGANDFSYISAPMPDEAMLCSRADSVAAPQ